MSMSITYTPGYGYAGYLPGSDKPVIRYGKEFVDSMIALAEQRKQEAQSATNPADSFTRRELTKTLAAELAAKYDTAKMTQEEYDSLLDDLLDEGILSKDELGLLGYHGMVVCGTLADFADIAGRGYGGMYSLDTAAVRNDPSLRSYERIYGCTIGLSDTGGNALAYAKLMALMKPVSGMTAGWLNLAEKKQNSYQVLVDVLEAMQKKS